MIVLLQNLRRRVAGGQEVQDQLDADARARDDWLAPNTFGSAAIRCRQSMEPSGFNFLWSLCVCRPLDTNGVDTHGSNLTHRSKLVKAMLRNVERPKRGMPKRCRPVEMSLENVTRVGLLQDRANLLSKYAEKMEWAKRDSCRERRARARRMKPEDGRDSFVGSRAFSDFSSAMTLEMTLDEIRLANRCRQLQADAHVDVLGW